MNITRALQRAVKKFAGGAGAAAMAPAMNPPIQSGTLSNKTNPNFDGAHCSPEEMVQVMQLSKDYSALIAMADECSSDEDLFIVVKVPRAGLTATDEQCTEALLASIKKFSDFASTGAEVQSADSPAGFDITENESSLVDQMSQAAIAGIHEFARRCRQKCDAGRPSHLRAA